VLVRRERPDDVAAVRAVVAAAFPTPDGVAEPVEARLLDALRVDPGWLPAFSLVAVDPDGEVVGHIVATRGDVDGHPGLGLGPIAVRPEQQGRGVGTALVHAVLGAAEARHEVLIALLGDPAFYGRFGLRPAAEHGITSPDPAWGEHFQVRPLAGPPPRGRFRYAAPFAEL
jgi:putative acetyltransferase